MCIGAKSLVVKFIKLNSPSLNQIYAIVILLEKTGQNNKLNLRRCTKKRIMHIPDYDLLQDIKRLLYSN